MEAETDRLEDALAAENEQILLPFFSDIAHPSNGDTCIDTDRKGKRERERKRYRERHRERHERETRERERDIYIYLYIGRRSQDLPTIAESQ